jgi:hypothetical protein
LLVVVVVLLAASVSTQVLAPAALTVHVVFDPSDSSVSVVEVPSAFVVTVTLVPSPYTETQVVTPVLFTVVQEVDVGGFACETAGSDVVQDSTPLTTLHTLIVPSGDTVVLTWSP